MRFLFAIICLMIGFLIVLSGTVLTRLLGEMLKTKQWSLFFPAIACVIAIILGCAGIIVIEVIYIQMNY